jgi:imidazolonepropionase-like amidohydrolase
MAVNFSSDPTASDSDQQLSTMRFIALLAFAGIAACSSHGEAVSLATSPYRAGSLAIHCGTLIDGLSAQPTRDITIVIRDGKIVSVAAGQNHPADLAWLDLGDHTCLPGLIDMHTHLTDRPEDTADMQVYFKRSAQEVAALSAEHAKATLLAGFTAVRNLGTYIAWSDRDLRDAINRGDVAGPRMQVTGFYLTIPKGGGDLFIPGVPEAQKGSRYRAGVARGAEEFANRARAAIDGGADVLKVIASGAVLAFGGVPGEPEMTPEEIAAVVKVAHAANRKVAAHAHGARSIKEAILAGADTIEHASIIDEAGIRLARERNVALAMDVYNGDYIDTEGRKNRWPEEFLRKNIETTESQRQAFTKAHAAAVAIVYATDAGVFPHGLNARQFPIMVQRGMTPMQAIQAATSVAASYMGWEDRVGAVVAGRYGDVIAVKGDPLKDITVLQNVAVVVKDGLLFKKE